MKKSILAVLAIGLILSFSTVAMALQAGVQGTPGTGIKLTAHDLSSLGKGGIDGYGDTVEQGLGVGYDRICIYCHAPHNTIKPNGAYTYMPLWNHLPSTTVNFTMYSNTLTGDTPGSAQHQSQAMAEFALLSSQPGSVSLLCLSCHDGTVGTNAYGQAGLSSSIGAGDKNLTGTKWNIGQGGDLSNHHPIGFDYQSVIDNLDDEIADTTVAIVGGQATGPQTIADLLWGGKVECVSCHDVHNTKNTGEKFTWIADTNSALCLTCHLKSN
jgi:predicted CXXCH cytochrome family protein